MTRLRFTVVLGACLGLAACEAAEEGDGTCREDFECAVGQVCTVPSGEDAGSCTDAGPTDTRSFGVVDLEFAGGGEAYLVSVVSIPAGAEATTTSEASFTLEGGAGLSALRLASTAAPAADPTLAARAAFDAVRHAQVAAIAARSASTRAVQVLAACGDCGGEMCWDGSCTSAATVSFLSGATSVSMDLACVVDAGPTAINVLLDTTSAAAADTVCAAVGRFASTFAQELELLGLTGGHGGPLDRDGDGRLTIAFTNAVGPGVGLEIVGFFDPNDFGDAADPDATGNQADILWARVPGTVTAAGELTTDLAVGTLVHEYEHLASFALRVHARPGDARQEVIWLDEGLAHLMEDLTGWGGSNIGYVEAAFLGWNTTPFAASEDPQGQRGKSFLLLRHLIERSGRTPGAVIGELLADTETGLEHPFIASEIGERLWQWQLATYATNNPEVTEAAASAYDYQPTAEAATGYLTGVDPFGTYTDARGGQVSLTGPEVSDVLDPSGELGESIRDSGSMLFVVTGGSGTVSLRGRGPADVDLRLHAQRIQ